MTKGTGMTQLTLIKNAPKLGSVYYATDGCNIKIGHTERQPKRRGGEIKTEIIYSIPGGLIDERRHHRMWAKCRIPGTEWFRPADDMLLWLAAQLTQHGPTRELATLRQVILNHKQAERAA